MKSVAGVRCAKKANVDLGAWKTGQRFPKSALNLRGPYPIPTGWTWRQIKFSADGENYTIVLKFRKERHDFMAMLVHSGEPDTVLCRLEHHGSHAGWHIHYQCERPFIQGAANFPTLRVRECDQDTKFTDLMLFDFEAWAMTFAASAFGLREKLSDDFGELL